ncbi:hypothetical protein PROFUN_04099 [Planoprotostelium fungivorum]|uniref:F-box domain-containing protein n=1 Tax=Planoprotostelium fungivorum TaxID=1890364 RepID=A0A2P6NJH2_9EUKA|nr:hypothetical protein PROFUN_04099 [Planoprotostelium fungivorum]
MTDKRILNNNSDHKIYELLGIAPITPHRMDKNITSLSVDYWKTVMSWLPVADTFRLIQTCKTMLHILTVCDPVTTRLFRCLVLYSRAKKFARDNNNSTSYKKEPPRVPSISFDHIPMDVWDILPISFRNWVLRWYHPSTNIDGTPNEEPLAHFMWNVLSLEAKSWDLIKQKIPKPKGVKHKYNPQERWRAVVVHTTLDVMEEMWRQCKYNGLTVLFLDGPYQGRFCSGQSQGQDPWRCWSAMKPPELYE